MNDKNKTAVKYYGNGDCECSECGAILYGIVVRLSGYHIPGETYYRYCPTCGRELDWSDV